jgi:hypothetical protein
MISAKTYFDKYGINHETEIQELMIELAKLHVKEALKTVHKKLEYFEGCDRIEDLYPLKLILSNLIPRDMI